MRVLVFGDSVTQGYWDASGGWVDRLRTHFDTIQVSDFELMNEPTVFNLGISADNSANILRRIASETTARTRGDELPIVILQIGLNDSSSGNQSVEENVAVPIEQYAANLHEISSILTPLCASTIFVGSPACDETKTTPCFWGDYQYTNESIQRYESSMREVASACDIDFIPLFDRFKEALDSGHDFLPDGLHPNTEGHQFIADTIMPEILSLLSRK